jgi:hypothetical protein
MPGRRKQVPEKRLRPFDANIARSSGRMAERVWERVPFCWFCPSSQGKKSKEHIFPKWLSGHYDARTEMVTPVRQSRVSGQELSRRPAKPLSGFVCGDVCTTCNNGWMSQVEERVRPILTASKRSGRFSPDDALALARWFAKTAAVLNVSQPYRLLFPASDRHALATGLPDRVAVRLFRSRRQNGLVDWVQGGHSGSLTPPGFPAEAARSLLERTLITHIRVADLVGVVILVPAPVHVDAVIETNTGSAKIWPTPSRCPTWGGLPLRADYLDHFTTFDYNKLVLGW